MPKQRRTDVRNGGRQIPKDVVWTSGASHAWSLKTAPGFFTYVRLKKKNFFPLSQFELDSVTYKVFCKQISFFPSLFLSIRVFLKLNIQFFSQSHSCTHQMTSSWTGPQGHFFPLLSHMRDAQCQLMTRTETFTPWGITGIIRTQSQEWRCQWLGAETYGAKNQNVKTDSKDFYQSPFFNVVFLVVLGVSVGGEGSMFIKICLNMLAFHERKTQTRSRVSLPCSSSSSAAVGRGENVIQTHKLLSWNRSTTSHVASFSSTITEWYKICFPFKIKMNNF